MHRILAAVAISAAAAPLALLGTAGAAQAGEHGGDCDPSRGIEYCPNPPQPGFNLILGTRHDDTLFGTHGDDAILGRSGNDRVIGHGGADLLLGNRGDDTLIDDQPSFFGNVVTLRGGQGSDVCIGNVNDVFLACETVIVL